MGKTKSTGKQEGERRGRERGVEHLEGTVTRTEQRKKEKEKGAQREKRETKLQGKEEKPEGGEKVRREREGERGCQKKPTVLSYGCCSTGGSENPGLFVSRIPRLLLSPAHPQLQLCLACLEFLETLHQFHDVEEEWGVVEDVQSAAG